MIKNIFVLLLTEKDKQVKFNSIFDVHYHRRNLLTDRCPTNIIQEINTTIYNLPCSSIIEEYKCLGVVLKQRH